MGILLYLATAALLFAAGGFVVSVVRLAALDRRLSAALQGVRS